MAKEPVFQVVRSNVIYRSKNIYIIERKLIVIPQCFDPSQRIILSVRFVIEELHVTARTFHGLHSVRTSLEIHQDNLVVESIYIYNERLYDVVTAKYLFIVQSIKLFNVRFLTLRSEFSFYVYI